MWLLILLFTIIPVGLIMWTIYSLNEKEKQPYWMLGLLFIGGLLSFFLVRLTSSFLDGRVYELSSASPFLKQDWEFFLVAFGMIAVVEELSKFIMLNFFSFRSKKFKYPYDGIVYGVFVSLGFAFLENLMYLNNQGLGIALSRAIFTIPAHASFGIVMGYYLGLAKGCIKKGLNTDCLKYRYIAFFVPLILHGMYDYICNFNVNSAYYGLIAYTVFLYALAIIKMYKMNNLDISYYDEDNYKPDDIIMDYKDEATIHSEEIRKNLFEREEHGSFNPETKQYETNNFCMKMFSSDDDETNNNEQGHN